MGIVKKNLSVVLLLAVSPAIVAGNAVEDMRVINPVKAPAISLPDTNGVKTDIDYSATDITFVHFWASWCQPCKEEMPQLLQFARNMQAKNVQIIAIAADNASRTRAYIKSETVGIRLLIDQYGSSVYRFRVQVIPETFVINRNGVITHHLQGKMNWLDSSLVTSLISPI